VARVTPFHIKAFHDSSFKCFLRNYILDAKEVAGQEVVERNVRSRIDPGPRYKRPVTRSSADLLFLRGLHSNCLRESFAQMMGYYLNVGADKNNSNTA
jgi:hypothetical protein